ncbi:MAG TPA: YcgN family cysteine cluster protein [Sphingomicrobium sp.]|nr:YcgN family cysteine cluster protein [Sphingomicrobium sp.]
MSELVMADPHKTSAPFWEKPLSELDRGQWEALCDGCGRCCLHKLEDEDTGLLYPTNVACALLDRKNGMCIDYEHRKKRVTDCVVLNRKSVGTLDWLPESCAYRLRSENKPLPDWHYLISGSRETVHEAGQSTRGWTVSEADVDELEDHVIDRPL